MGAMVAADGGFTITTACAPETLADSLTTKLPGKAATALFRRQRKEKAAKALKVQ